MGKPSADRLPAAQAGATGEPPDGEILQDTSTILDTLEARHPELAFLPQGSLQRLVSSLFEVFEVFEVFGDEGLLKPAMHYRWSFPEANEAFLAAGGGATQGLAAR